MLYKTPTLNESEKSINTMKKIGRFDDKPIPQ